MPSPVEKRSRFWVSFRRYTLAGFLLVIPAALTAYILVKLLGIADGLITLLPPALQPQTYLGFPIPGLGLLLVLTVIVLTGLIATTYLGNRAVRLWETTLQRIPIVRGLYSSLKQLFQAVFSSNSQFSRTVLVQWPRADTWAIGFVTGELPKSIHQQFGREMISVFMPTTPNPTTGFYFIMPAEQVIQLELPVEEAFKVIMSAGLVFPDRIGEYRGALPGREGSPLPMAPAATPK